MKRIVLAIALLALAACNQLGLTHDYKTEVKRELRDPESAQFTDVEIGKDVACGFVNSKNGYGGYSGRAPFVVRWSGSGDPDTVVMSATEAQAMPDAFNACPASTQSAVIKWTTERIIEELKRHQ